MRPVVAIVALLSFLGVVAVTPVWMHFTHSHPAIAELPVQTRFMIQLVLPVFAMLLLASWFGPGGGA